MFNLIEELFSPNRKHTDDERQRLEHTRVETGSTDPGKGPIDLASGHVVIRPRPAAEPAQPVEREGAGGPGGGPGAGGPGGPG
ncbi:MULTISPECIES: DUF6191 domain-containing protein [Streptomyces]|uniref:DUF6191 domain-containing protein n=1 Tax=Streptomyces TaxID=1883 RepID=UPI0005266968|nr:MULTISPECIES: DUF6191 domain-containing protein [Streptomyces]KPC63504.1 hypothetical protein ADL27_61985 [Streptomyces sp. NRRL F-6602]